MSLCLKVKALLSLHCITNEDMIENFEKIQTMFKDNFCANEKCFQQKSLSKKIMPHYSVDETDHY